MARRERRLFWATVLGFVGGAVGVGMFLHRRSQIDQESASERAERLLQNCQDRIRQIERQLEQAHTGRAVPDEVDAGPS